MRNDSELSRIVEALVATAETVGYEMRPMAAAMIAEDLSEYPAREVFAALAKCRRELRGRVSLGDILDRIHANDGRPSADEAWAIAMRSADEAETVVWTSEIAEAMGVAGPVLDAGDKVGARMAFKDAYTRMVDAAREARTPARWLPSLGTDPERRALALESAHRAGLLPEIPQALLPAPNDLGPIVGALLLGGPAPDDETARRGIEMARRHLAALDAMAEERAEQARAEERRKVERFQEAKRRTMKAIEDLLAARKAGVGDAQ